MKKTNDTFLTVKDISKKLNICQSIIYTILRYDRLESECIGDRIVVKKEVFEKWAEKNGKQPKEGGEKQTPTQKA